MASYFQTWGTCRVCKNQAQQSELIKYGVRHYAHPKCAMEKFGASFFERIQPWQAKWQFPYFIAKKFGHHKALEARAVLDVK